MQQTATSTATTATAVTTKISESSVSGGSGGGAGGDGNDISQVTAASTTTSVTPNVKLEQLTGNVTTTTAAQVITVVAPSHTTQAHGQPVVVQVSSGGQYIAVAVSPENAAQNASSQHGDTVTSVGTPATNVSTEDEDQGATSFDDFTTDASYTNGNSNSGAMTYYTTDSYTTATAYYNSSVTYSQGVNQIIADGAYLVMEHTDPAALTATSTAQRTPPQTVHILEDDYKHLLTQQQQRISVQPQTETKLQNNNSDEGNNITSNNTSGASNTTTATAALLINPFSIHTTTDTNNIGAGSTIVVSGSNSNNNPTTIVTSPGILTSTTTNLHHQNVRDMDIVHVQWLIENYETAEGVSLPRSTLYSHYQQHCQQQGIEPVNAASFGKLIRSVFIGLRTRRLGTRGNSKYHYYGIRVKPGSVLAKTMDVSNTSGATSNSNSGNTSGSEQSNQQPVKRTKTAAQGNLSNTTATTKTSTTSSTENSHQATLSATSPEILQSYLGDPKSILSSVWPEEPTVSCNDTDSPSALATRFAACYRKHYEQVINAIGSLQFNLIEDLWRQFWQPDQQMITNSNSLKDEKLNHLSMLTLSQLHQLTNTTPSPSSASNDDETALTSLADWIIQTDYTLYNSLITSLLLPNLLKPIPQQLTQQIRNFAKNIGPWMTNCLAGYDETFVQLKVSAVSAFSHTLRRYTSLNHLSSAARAVLQNQQQIQQMINDLNRVDFKNVQEQASWVCQCEDHIVEQIEQSFKMLLQETNPFDKWGLWCEQVLDMCLQDNEVRSSTQFFFKWGFYSSLVMRDLTLRSASSFGSFHLIRLLFDEYIFYLIEHRVAKATGKTPLQVLGEARTIRNQNNLGPN